MKFEDLGLITPLLKTLAREGFSTPTEIQEKVIPLAISGKDILGSAQTGSGKTLAFTLPILQRLYTQRLAKNLPDGQIKRKILALIVAPTRELAVQIGEACKPYCSDTNMKHSVIFGGVNDFHQIKAIEKGVDIVIATPGRLEDLISQGVIKLSYIEILVLDEADRMLDLGFMADVKKILKRVPTERQTLLFSATMPKEIQELANSILKNPENIRIKSETPTVEKIDQYVYHIKSSHKRQLLQRLVKDKKYPSMIVFVKTRDDVEYVEAYVKAAQVKVDSIHKDKSQNARQRALNSLKNGDIKVLVATDIASRGIDIHGLSCVVNYHMPTEAETYVHRIGRTARAGKTGVAITLCIDHEEEMLASIEKLIGQKIQVVEDTSYKEEVISKSKILGYSNFEENAKDKFKKKTRKPQGKIFYPNTPSDKNKTQKKSLTSTVAPQKKVPFANKNPALKKK